VQSDVYSFTEFKISPHQVVFCYGLIYHLDKPLAALTKLAAHCTELLLIETAVAYGEQDGAISYHTEEAGNLTNSVSGLGTMDVRSLARTVRIRLHAADATCARSISIGLAKQDCPHWT
jgi:hypothetical protein